MIGEGSDSYPYLALARRLGVDYGTVLWHVDLLDGGEYHPQCLVVVHLTVPQMLEIDREYALERARREKRR